MYNIGSNTANQHGGSQGTKTHGNHLLRAKFLNQRTEEHSHDHLHHITDTGADGVKAPGDIQIFGDSAGV